MHSTASLRERVCKNELIAVNVDVGAARLGSFESAFCQASSLALQLSHVYV